MVGCEPSPKTAPGRAELGTGELTTADADTDLGAVSEAPGGADPNIGSASHPSPSTGGAVPNGYTTTLGPMVNKCSEPLTQTPAEGAR